MSVFLSVLRLGDPNPDFPDMPEMADLKPISIDEIRQAVASAPHYRIVEAEGSIGVEVPCGAVGSVWLAYNDDSGVLSFQMQSTYAEHSEEILGSLRRFAGFIPEAVVDAEGEIFQPLPWDGRRLGGAN